MQFVRYKYGGIILIMLGMLVMACNPKLARIHVGQSRKQVQSYANWMVKMHSNAHAGLIAAAGGDTLLLKGYHANLPLEMLWLFKNNKCVYQEYKIQCSRCARQFENDLIQNKSYQFQTADSINYTSTLHPDVVLRKGFYPRDSMNCAYISVRKITHKQSPQ